MKRKKKNEKNIQFNPLIEVPIVAVFAFIGVAMLSEFSVYRPMHGVVFVVLLSFAYIVSAIFRIWTIMKVVSK